MNEELPVSNKVINNSPKTVDNTSVMQLTFLTKKRKQINSSRSENKQSVEKPTKRVKSTTATPKSEKELNEPVVQLKCEVSEDKGGTNQCKKCRYCTDHCPPGTLTDEKKSRQIECLECKKIGKKRMFKTQNSLDIHIKYCHKEDASFEFSCDVCSKSRTFTIRSKYVSHMLDEHRIQVFICDVCSASFRLKLNYKMHLASHGLPDVKPFVCNTCSGTFVNRAGYESHKKRFPGPHQKHFCEECGVSFTRVRAVKNHRCKKLQIEEAAVAMAEHNGDRYQKDDNYDCEDSTEYKTLSLTSAESLSLEQASDSEQLVIRELAGQIVPGTQLLQFEVNDSEHPHQIYQVNVADWNMVTPFVIRDATIAAAAVTTLQETPAPE